MRGRWLLLGGAALLALPVGVVLVLLQVLDAPPVQARICRLLRESTGLQVQYGRLQVRLGSGLHLEDLRLLAPPPYDGLEPVLLQVGGVDVAWSPRRLLSGQGPLLDEVTLRDVALRVAADARGNSLGALLARLPRTAESRPPPGPLSQRLRHLLPDRPPIGRLVLEGLRLALSRAGGERAELGGVRLEAGLRQGQGGLEAELRVGAAPLQLRLMPGAQGPVRTARAQLHLVGSVRRGVVRIESDLGLAQQDLRPELPSQAEILSWAAEARWQPEQGRVALELRHLRLLDGALKLQAVAEVLDEAGRVRLARGTGQLDLARLGPFAPLVGAQMALAQGVLELEGVGVQLAPALQVEPGGALRAEGRIGGLELALAGLRAVLRQLELRARGVQEGAQSRLSLVVPIRGLRLERAGGAVVELDSAELRGTGRRTEGQPPQLEAELSVARAGLSAGRWHPQARALRAELKATVRDGAHLDAELQVGLGSLSAAPLTLKQLQLALGLSGLDYASQAPLRSRGLLRLRGQLGALSWAQGRDQLVVEQLGLEASSRLRGEPPWHLDLHLPIGRLALRHGGRHLLPRAGGRVDLSLSQLQLAEPLGASRGVLRVEGALGGVQLVLAADKTRGSATFALDGRADSLALLRLLEPGLAGAWERMGLALRSRGTLSGLLGGAPQMAHHTELRLWNVVLPGGGARAERAQMELDSQGTLRRHQGTASLVLSGLVLRGRTLGDTQLRLRAEADLDRPRLRLELSGGGMAGPQGQMAVSLDFARAERALAYAAEVRLHRLGVLEALLPPGLVREHRVTWPSLGIGLQARGTVRGAVRGFSRDLVPLLAEDALAALRGEQSLALQVDGLRYEGHGRRVELPALQATARLEAGESRLVGEAGVSAPRLRLQLEDQALEVRDLRPQVKLTSRGDPRRGELDIAVDLTVGSAAGRTLHRYPVKDMSLSAHIQRRADGTVRLRALRLLNPGARTRLEAEGGLELTMGGAVPVAAEALAGGMILGRRSLELEGKLEQDLAHVGLVEGSGRLGLAFRVESPDLRLAHVRGSLQLDGVRVRSGRDLVEGMRGEVPLEQDLAWRPGQGLVLVGRVRPNAYRRLRFSDHHPFVGGNNYVAIERAELAGVRLGQLAGNVRIDRNLLAVDQLEARLRGGVITGQLLLDWRGADSEVLFRGAVTNVRPSRDEGGRLDASGALGFQVRGRLLEGRVEIVRLDRRHLQDLIDVIDPNMESVGLNRVRRALKLGYPRRVTLLFADGFASLDVEFGGLAEVVRVDRVSGIPVGPFIEHYLGDFLRGLETP
ncbi:MAG: hypothetical protein RMK29_01305 [Myxococcales bacterium]|nr:hypothetical protein [Myxococcota bacterium]MDW8280315.1 hypothetical protein [Myxococcales bacterium]